MRKIETQFKKTMNALISTPRLSFQFSKPSPLLKPKFPILLPKIFKTAKNLSTKCQLNANAKGFTSRKPQHITKEDSLNIKATTRRSKEDDELPSKVVYRVIRRILVAVGVPMILGLASLKVFENLREQGVDVPVWVIFTTCFITFGASALGIAYGALSSSLEADKEGSLLGFEEIQENWVEMWNEEEEEGNAY